MGGPNMLTMNGEAWKNTRAMFNPGFSHKYILDQVPGLMDSIEGFRENLRERADTRVVFPLEEILTRLTMDIITKVTLPKYFYCPDS
jgi:cytochrome P450